jgi:hypothetical protein
MTGVTKVVDYLGKDVTEVVEELNEMVLKRRVTGLMVTMEVVGQMEPLTALAGRFRTDPYRALLATERTRRRLHVAVDRIARPRPYDDS